MAEGSLESRIGKTFVRKQLHDNYGGQRFGGISTPSNAPYVFLFTKGNETFSRGGFGRMGDEERSYCYTDEWVIEEVDGKKVPLYIYSGEGLKGNMKLKAGNLAIYSHQSTGKTLLLFHNIGNGHVQLIASVKYENHFFNTGRDIDGAQRQHLYFVLSPTSLTLSHPKFWSLVNLDKKLLNTPSQLTASSDVANFEREQDDQKVERLPRRKEKRENIKKEEKEEEEEEEEKEEEESPLVIDLSGSAPARHSAGSYQYKKEHSKPPSLPSSHQRIAQEKVKKEKEDTEVVQPSQKPQLAQMKRKLQEDSEQMKKRKHLLQIKKRPPTSFNLDDLLAAHSSYLSQLKPENQS
eukprot:TRINITY_DN4847_c0_g1_i1.p1 TRINITY_DN4847_c0_g1~~TRINITY_DN4847_c0_g1_i1.p1  ORF type:complete len:350 (+),score=82.90 TRINITY_DN4847_c0_g1_i1:19-1068(+)